jgi:hypothetical protein
MSTPNEKKDEGRQASSSSPDSWAKEFEETYSNVGVQVSRLTQTGSWRVVEDDDTD